MQVVADNLVGLRRRIGNVANELSFAGERLPAFDCLERS